MNLAAAAAERSEDPYCQVGATVLDRDGVVLGVGYNGTPSGVTGVDWTDRDARRPYMIHAEANALRHTTPPLAHGGLLAVTHYPCAACCTLARSYGIHTVFWASPPDWQRYPKLDEAFLIRLGVVLWQVP